MAGQVVALKGSLEGNLNGMGLKSIHVEYNYLGLPAEMINFVYMACVSGKGGEIKEAERICWIPIVMVDGNGNPIYNEFILMASGGQMKVPVSHDAGNNPYNNSNLMASLAVIDRNNEIDDQDYGYFYLSYNIPGKGQSVLGLGVEQYKG